MPPKEGWLEDGSHPTDETIKQGAGQVIVRGEMYDTEVEQHILALTAVGSSMKNCTKEAGSLGTRHSCKNTFVDRT